MPDKREYLREHLGKLGLAPHREEEILRELAEHLEDHADELARCGVPKAEALERALCTVSDWPALSKQILLAETEEVTMNYRTRVLWLPALCALTVTNALPPLLYFAGLHPHFLWLSKGMSRGLFFATHVPWLIALPFIGAGAAFWSQRAGGRVQHRLLSALAPAISFMIIALNVLPISLVVDRGVPLSLKASACAAFLVSWGLLPSLALLIGAAPFLRRPQPQS